MRDAIYFQNRDELKPPTFNPKEFTLSSSGVIFPLCLIKGSGENKTINTLFIHGNSTAEYVSGKYFTQKYHETGYDDNSFLTRVLQRLDMLNQLSSNWDGYNAEKPNTIALKRARSFFFEKIFSFLPNVLSNPNITANSEGDIVLEWWFHNKKLTIYIAPEQISYIKVAGERLEDMEDGFLNAQYHNQLDDLFIWLIR